ncbi:MAG: hypothetical protein ACR65U_08525 [Methylocystis sp.]
MLEKYNRWRSAPPAKATFTVMLTIFGAAVGALIILAPLFQIGRD